jgi:hypothetical protein
VSPHACRRPVPAKSHPRADNLHRVLDRTYLRPAPTQEKAAELLDLPLKHVPPLPRPRD